MSTSSAIRTAWQTKIFDHATVIDYTTQTFLYDVDQNIKAGVEVGDLYYLQQINFFKCLVFRSRITPVVGGGTSNVTRFVFDVELSYYLEKDLSDSGINYNNVIDRLEAVDSLVISQLGKTWDSTVDFAEMINAQGPQIITLDEKDVWRGTYTYRAFRHA